MPAVKEMQGYKRIIAIFACFLFGSAIGLSGYYGGISLDIRISMRLGLAAVFLAALFIFRRKEPAWQTSLAFFGVTAGICVAGFVGNHPLVWMGIAANDAHGYAVSKAFEALPIILTIFLATMISGCGLEGMRLCGGRYGASILSGVGIGAVLFVYFLSQGGWQIVQDGNLVKLLPTIGWVTIFSMFNSFMEELWFRGLFLSRFEWLLGPRWAFWLSALTFGLLHAFGSFTGTLGSLLLTLITLLLGIAFCFIVQRTRNLWGAVVGHFFADFFMMLGYFATQGA